MGGFGPPMKGIDMATINAPSLQDVQYSGDCPVAISHGYITLANQPANDVIRLNRLYAGTKIFDSHIVNAALGAGVTLTLGFQYVDGQAGGADDALIPATASANAGRINATKAPIVLQYDAFIVAKIAGGPATGKIDTVVQYEFEGK